MLRVVILLEDDFFLFVPVVLECLDELVIKDLCIQLCIEASFDFGHVSDAFGHVSDAFGCEATPHHQASTAELDCSFDFSIR